MHEEHEEHVGDTFFDRLTGERVNAIRSWSEQALLATPSGVTSVSN